MSTVTAFTGGTILSMDSTIGEPEVVVVADGRIAAAGDRDLLAAHPDAELIDLAGRTLVPGFIDAHHHLSVAALHPLWADLSGATNLDEAGKLLREAADRDPDAAWVRGCMWDERTGLSLRGADLDALGIDRPVVVACFSLHRAVVSSAALDALGISASTPDPDGGRIDRNAGGAPTGLLMEQAWAHAHARSMEAYSDPDRWGDLIEARLRLLLSQGVTAVHDAATSPEAEAVYRALAAAGRLPGSVLMMPHSSRLLINANPDRWDGPRTGEGDERLRVGAVKFFADGAWELAVDAEFGGVTTELGLLFPGLAEGMAEAVERGFGVAVHAMGNRGLAHTLARWEEATRGREPSHGLRIEHVTLAGSGEIEHMRRLEATGIIQGGFIEAAGDTAGVFPLENATWMPFAALAESGIILAGSSDSPCSVSEPLTNARFGVSRTTSKGAHIAPDQSLPMREWLRLYTAGSAAAGGQSDERGRLAPGLRADLVVLEGDLGGVDVSVAQTWVDGERVCDASA